MIKEGLNKMNKQDRTAKKKRKAGVTRASDIANNEIAKTDIESRDLEE
jgi:hypothetical protein